MTRDPFRVLLALCLLSAAVTRKGRGMRLWPCKHEWRFVRTMGEWDEVSYYACRKCLMRETRERWMRHRFRGRKNELLWSDPE